MKSRLVFTAVFFLVFCMSAYGTEVSVPQLSAQPGDIITVAISVDDTTGIAAGDIKLVYDSNILAAMEARGTDLAAGLTVVSNIEVAGEVVISMLSVTLTGLPAATGALLEVDFEVIAEGQSPLTLAEASFSDETAADIPTTAVDGSVTVEAAEDPEAVMRATWQGIIEALNAHDLDQYLPYLTDDVVVDAVPMPAPASGKDEVAALMGGSWQGFPDLQFNLGRVITSGNILVSEYTTTGTHLGEWMDVPPTGNSVQVMFLDIMDFEEGKVKRSTNYWDIASLMVQLGVMPAPELDPALLVPSFTLPDPEATGLTPLEAEAELNARWNTHDLSLYAKGIQPDADIMVAALGVPMDRDAFIASQELYFLAFPDLRMDTVRSIDMGDGWLAVEVVFTGTHDGPYFGIPATGRTVEVRGAWLARYDEDGLETNLNIYFDNLTVLAQIGALEPAPDTEANKALVSRYFEEVWHQGNLDLVDEFVSADIVGHVPEGDFLGTEGAKQHVIAFRTPFPDIHFTFEDMIAEGDKVAARWTSDATHTGELMGIPPTGVQTTVTGMFIFQIGDGKLVEVWSIADMLGLMQQLGVIDPMGREDFAWGVPSEVIGAPGTPEENKDIERRSIEAWNQGDLDIIDELFATDFVYHIVGIPDVHGPEGVKQVITMYRTAFPDLDFTAEDMVAEADKVVLRWKATGTHKGEYMGIPPTGKQMAVTGMSFGRFADGKFVEEWAVMDSLGLLQQITPPEVPTKDYTNVFFLSLAPGLNMISLPLEPIEPYTARSFAEEILATVVIRYDEVLKKFEGFALNAPGDGFAIEGGKGYIVNVPEGGVVAFTGAAWTNEPPLEPPPPPAAPPLAVSDSAWAFVVSGSVLDGDGMSAEDGSYTLTAKNLRTGATATETVDTSGYSAAVWADLSRKAVIEAGDEVEVAVTDSSGRLASGPFVHEITLDEIRNAVLDVRLRLGHIIPEKMALLQNYPNPFNPETWIPFHLSDQASVSIRIYNATGQLVRTLDLGHRDAGVYVSRSEAAYWDGKNEAGEAVASGIYFYSITVTADDFSATRKMVIRK